MPYTCAWQQKNPVIIMILRKNNPANDMHLRIMSVKKICHQKNNPGTHRFPSARTRTPEKKRRTMPPQKEQSSSRVW